MSTTTELTGRLRRTYRAASNRSVAFKYAFVIPALLYALAWVVYPLVFLVRLSLSTDVGGTFVGLKNFGAVLGSPDLYDSVLNTLVFSIPAVGLELVLGVALALTYGSISRFERTTQTLLLVPMVLTPFAVGLMFRWFFNSGLGIVNYLFSVVGLGQPVWLSDPLFAMVSVIVADIWQWTPFVFIMAYAGLQTIPESHVEAAMIDGASRLERFRYILLPQLYPVLLITTLIRLVMVFKSSDKIAAMTGGGPGSSTKTLSRLIYENAFSFLNTAEAAAMSVLFLIVITLVGSVFITVLSRVEEGA